MNKQRQVNLPYFDYLLTCLNERRDLVEKSFGRHVHWGYWQRPQEAQLSTEDFAEAAENLSRQICRQAQIKDTQRILDVGCGFGGTIAHLNENYSTMDLFGLNLDVRQLTRARSQVQPLAGNKIQFQQGNACTLPFADNSFDVVLAVECIFHFPDRRQFFQEAYRVLKPGGFLSLSDFVPSTLLLPATKIPLPEPLRIGFYGSCNIQCTLGNYRNMAKSTGFKVEIEDDITANTLPTYQYLRNLGLKIKVNNPVAISETLVLELLSRLRGIKYFIFSFRKVG